MLAIIRKVGTLLTRRDRPRVELPAPGSHPLDRPSTRGAITILVIVIGDVLWQIGQGQSPATALAITAGTGLIATEIVGRMCGATSSLLNKLTDPSTFSIG